MENDITKEVALLEEAKTPRDVSPNQNALDIAAEEMKGQIAPLVESKRKYMFRHNDPILNKWDTFIILCAIYNCFTLSLNIGFSPSYADHWLYITVDVFLILCYVLDIIQNFFTTYLDPNGEEIWNKKVIAKNYVFGGRFIIDILSTIPFDYFGGPELLAMLGLLKLTRLSRINTIIARLNANEQIKALLKMAQLTFNLFLVIHITGCVWYWIIKQEKEWIPPFDWVQLPAGNTNLYTNNLSFRYWASFYNAILLLAGNELGPRTNLEYIYISVMMTSGTLIFANIFGEMAVLVQVMTKKQVKFQEQVDTANTTMKTLSIHPEVKQQVRDYFLFTQVTLDEQEELDKFLALLCPTLKLEITIHIFAKLMKRKLFAKQEKVDQTIRFLVMKFVTVLSVPEDIIFRQDEESTDMYFIAKGECSINIRDYRKREYNDYVILRPGDHFGEISLLYGCARTATVTSRNYSTLGKISKDLIYQIQSDNPGIVQHLRAGVYKCRDPNKRFIETAMKKIDYFNNLKDESFTACMYSLKKNSYKKGHVLFKEEQDTSSFSIVYEGIVEIYTYFEGSEFVLERLYPGSIFNFRTFFMDDLTYVNARCRDQVTLLEVSKETIEDLMSKHSDFCRKMLSYQNKILKFSKIYPLDYLVNVPKEYQKEKIYSEEALKRDNSFKNAIMRRVIEIREEKKKPKLSDLLKMFEGKNLSDPKVRDQLKKKLYALYEETDEVKANQFSTLNKLLEQIQKALKEQQESFKRMDDRLTQVDKIRKESTKKIPKLN